jgi:hypothetical protein
MYRGNTDFDFLIRLDVRTGRRSFQDKECGEFVGCMAGVAVCHFHKKGCTGKSEKSGKPVDLEKAPQMCGHCFIDRKSLVHFVGRIFWTSIRFLRLLSSTTFSDLV